MHDDAAALIQRAKEHFELIVLNARAIERRKADSAAVRAELSSIVSDMPAWAEGDETWREWIEADPLRAFEVSRAALDAARRICGDDWREDAVAASNLTVRTAVRARR